MPITSRPCASIAFVVSNALVFSFIATSPALAFGEACVPTWVPTFGGLAGTNGDVNAIARYDDGSGPAVYVAGSFTEAGGLLAGGVAKWDGSAWSPISASADGPINALEVGGVSRWDGANWWPLGGTFSSSPTALVTYDDGSGGGPRIVAVGGFTTVGGQPFDRIARWNGLEWTPFAVGDFGNGINAAVVVPNGPRGTPALVVLRALQWAPTARLASVGRPRTVTC